MEKSIDMGRYRNMVWVIAGLLCLAVTAWGQVGPGPDGPTVQYTITASAGDHGTVTPSGTVRVTSGKEQRFRISPDKDYLVDQVLVDDKAVDFTAEGGIYTFSGVTGNHTLKVSFRQEVFNISTKVSPVGQGLISPVSAEVGKGKDVSFAVRVEEGYTLKDVKASSGKKLAASGTEGDYILQGVTADDVVTATFAPKEYMIKTDIGEGGKLALSPSVGSSGKLAYGTKVTVTVTPDKGYETESVRLNGIPLYTETFEVKEDATVSVSFKKATYVVTLTAPEGGTLTAKNGAVALRNGSYQLPHGTELTLEAKAATGYEFGSYTSVPETAIRDHKLTVTGAVTLGADFALQGYPVTIKLPDTSDGVLLVNGQEAIAGNKTYPYGTILTLGNRPRDGKLFGSYTVSPGRVLSGNRVTVTEALTIGVLFKDEEPGKPGEEGGQSYTVTFPSSVNVRTPEGTISSGVLVKEGTVLTLVVSNTRSDVLSALTVNGNPVEFTSSGDVNVGYHTVTSAVAIQPSFRKNTFRVNLDVPVGGNLEACDGSTLVENGREVDYGTVLRVTATASEGYSLERILANSSDITLSGEVTVTEGIRLSASFRKQSGFDPEPDPGSPDPDRPVGIDLSPQERIYNREAQTFNLNVLPGGVAGHVEIGYIQDGKAVVPRRAGIYDVTLKRPADAVFGELDLTIPGGLVIRKAPVSILKVNYLQDQVMGDLAVTEARIEGGKAVYLDKDVKGSFFWLDNGKTDLSVTTSSYYTVCFKPDDTDNYREATAQVYVQVGEVTPKSYTLHWTREGEGEVRLYNGTMPVPLSGPFYQGMPLSVEAEGSEGSYFVRHEIERMAYADNPYHLIVNRDMDIKTVFKKKADPAKELAVTITPPLNLTYDGDAKLVSVSSVPSLTGWEVVYKDANGVSVVPREAGTYTVTVSRPEDGLWLAVEKQQTFTVKKAVPVVAVLPKASNVQIGASLGDSYLSGGEVSVEGVGAIAGTFRWEDTGKLLTQAGTLKGTVKFTPEDLTNFYSIRVEVDVLVVTGPEGEVTPVIITYGRPDGGSLSVTLADGTLVKNGDPVVKGSELLINVKADAYHTFSSLRVGGEDYTARALEASGNVRVVVNASKHIEAVFARTGWPDVPEPVPSHYTIWVSATDGGSVTPGTSKVAVGTSLSFRIIPEEGYEIVDVRVNGTSIGTVGSYTFVNVRADATLDVRFGKKGIPVYTLTTRISGGGGIVSPSLARVSRGGGQTFLIVPDEGNKTIDVLVGTSDKDLRSMGALLSYTFTDVRADSLLVVAFSGVTGIDKVGLPLVKAYAIQDVLYVETGLPTTVRVYDITGGIRYSSVVTGDTQITGLTKGVYMVVLDRGTGRKVVKVRIN